MTSSPSPDQQESLVHDLVPEKIEEHDAMVAQLIDIKSDYNFHVAQNLQRAKRWLLGTISRGAPVFQAIFLGQLARALNGLPFDLPTWHQEINAILEYVERRYPQCVAAGIFACYYANANGVARITYYLDIPTTLGIQPDLIVPPIDEYGYLLSVTGATDRISKLFEQLSADGTTTRLGPHDIQICNPKIFSRT
jgi:hypothetical protein